MNRNANTDRIAYLVISEPGGVDGMDRNDKGGVIVLATFDKQEAENRKGLDCRFRIEKRIIDKADADRAIAKLDKLELLLVQERIFSNI